MSYRDHLTLHTPRNHNTPILHAPRKRPPHLPGNPQPQHPLDIPSRRPPRKSRSPIPAPLLLPLNQDTRPISTIPPRGAKVRRPNERVRSREVGRGFLQGRLRQGRESGVEDFFALGADHAGCCCEVFEGGEEGVEVGGCECAVGF